MIVWDNQTSRVIAERQFGKDETIEDLRTCQDLVVLGFKEKIMVFNFDSNSGLNVEIDKLVATIDKRGLFDLQYNKESD